jgi:hypothetical protein
MCGAIKRPLAHSFDTSEGRAFVESSIQGTSFCVCAGGVGAFCIVSRAVVCFEFAGIQRCDTVLGR